MRTEAQMIRTTTRAMMSAAMIFGLVASAGAAEAEENYTIDAKILAVRAGDLNRITVQGERIEMHPSEGSEGAGSVVFGELGELQIGSWTVTIDDDGSLLWNGKPGLPAEANVDLITEPRLRVIAGRKAVIMTRSQLQYFESTGDGLYALRTTDQENAPGVELGCTVTPEEEDRVVLDIDLKLVLMERREEIPEVKLDVGRPLLLTRAISSRLLIAQDQWALVSAQQVESASDDGGHFLLCLLRVRR
jgi:hypothetical protein